MVIGIVMFIVLIIVGFALNDTYKGIGWDLLISGIAGIVGAFFLTDFIENHKRFKPFGMYAAWLKKPKGSAMRHAMHYFITVLLIALVLITPIHNYCKTDYFKYNDTVYVNSHYSWFEYDDDSYDYNEISRSAVPQEVLDNKSLYGFDYSDLVWDSSITVSYTHLEPAAMSKISDVREQAIRSVLSVNSAVHRLTCLRQYLSAMRVHK